MGSGKKRNQGSRGEKELKPRISQRALERTALRTKADSLRRNVMTLTPRIQSLDNEVKRIKQEIRLKMKMGETITRKD